MGEKQHLSENWFRGCQVYRAAVAIPIKLQFTINVIHFLSEDVAQLVLKKCTSTNAKDGSEGTSPDSKDYAVTFSYEFIEDSEDAKE